MTDTTTTDTRSDEQEEMVKAARHLPGVQEVIEVYGRLAPFQQVLVVNETTITHYATGGNVPG